MALPTPGSPSTISHSLAWKCRSTACPHFFHAVLDPTAVGREGVYDDVTTVRSAAFIWATS